MQAVIILRSSSLLLPNILPTQLCKRADLGVNLIGIQSFRARSSQCSRRWPRQASTRLQLVLEGHGRFVSTVMYLPDGRIVTSSWSRFVKV